MNYSMLPQKRLHKKIPLVGSPSFFLLLLDFPCMKTIHNLWYQWYYLHSGANYIYIYIYMSVYMNPLYLIQDVSNVCALNYHCNFLLMIIHVQLYCVHVHIIIVLCNNGILLANNLAITYLWQGNMMIEESCVCCACNWTIIQAITLLWNEWYVKDN